MTPPIALYHCTTVEALESILSEGLLSSQSQSSLLAVFLSDCPHLASGYAGQRHGGPEATAEYLKQCYRNQ